MADITTLYRGQNWVGPSNYLQSLNPGMPANQTVGGLTKAQLSRLAGQYWTTNQRMAESYGPKIRSMKVPSNYLDKFKRFEKMVTKLPSGLYKHAGVPAGAYLVPKSIIKNVSSGIDLGKTFRHRVRNLNYPLKGLIDKGKILKAGWDIMGEGYTLGDKIGQLGKNIAQGGLGFLKQNALRTLSTLGSLPVQAGLMTLHPTPANADEADMTAEDFRKLAIQHRNLSQYKNIPGTPIVPMDKGRNIPNIPGTPIVPMGRGGYEQSGGAQGTPSDQPGGQIGGLGGHGPARWAYGGRVDKLLSGRSRDI